MIGREEEKDAPGGLDTTAEPIAEALSRFEASEDGKSVLVDDGIRLKVETVEEWYVKYRYFNRIFRRWCLSNIKSDRNNDALAVFGDAIVLLDADRMEIRWFAWFYDCLTTYLADVLGASGVTQRLVDQLVAIIEFECTYDLHRIGNPALFPRHTRIIALLSGFDEPEARPNGNVFREAAAELQGIWDEDAEGTGLVVSGLCRKAGEMSLACRYDPDELFESFRASVELWAHGASARNESLRGISREDFALAVNRLAMTKMIANEKAIVKSISDITCSKTQERAGFDRSRLPSLRQGTAYRPA